MITGSYFFDGLGSYAPGTVLVAFVVTAGVYFLKQTKLKKYAANIWIKLLPFVLSVIVYAVYYCLSKMTLDCFLNETSIIVQQGFTAGCLATIISALLDKIIGKSELSGKALLTRKLLEGFIADDDLESMAQRVADVISSSYSEEDVTLVCAVLADYKKSKGETAEEEILLLSKLIVSVLKRTT